MPSFKTICAAATLAVAMPLTATAATSLLETIMFDYDENSSVHKERDPTGTDVVSGDRVIISDKPANFLQEFEFASDFASRTIDRFEITLVISQVSDRRPASATDLNGELWYADIRPASNLATSSFLKELPGTRSINDPLSDDPQTPNLNERDIATDIFTFTFVLNADNDIGEMGSDRIDGIANTAFSDSVMEGRVRLRFREESAAANANNPDSSGDSFELLSAAVSVYEVAAPVPLPASGLLLLGAVGGMAAWKRRKAA